jgi:hypothetical protein
MVNFTIEHLWKRLTFSITLIFHVINFFWGPGYHRSHMRRQILLIKSRWDYYQIILRNPFWFPFIFYIERRGLNSKVHILFLRDNCFISYSKRLRLLVNSIFVFIYIFFFGDHLRWWNLFGGDLLNVWGWFWYSFVYTPKLSKNMHSFLIFSMLTHNQTILILISIIVIQLLRSLCIRENCNRLLSYL